MYYCYWTNCEYSPSKYFKKFEELSKCLKYADTIKYVTRGDYGHMDTNHEGAHYIEIGEINGGVFLRIYHHWDDLCGYKSESESEESESE